MSADLSYNRIALLNSVIWPDGTTAYNRGFRSLTEVSRSLSENYNSFWRFVNRRGVVYYEEILIKGDRKSCSVTISHNVKVSNGLLCDIYGIGLDAYNARRGRGFTKRQALELDTFLDARTIKGQKTGSDFKIKKSKISGELAKRSSNKITFSEICQKRGLTEPEVKSRLESGQTIRQALEFEPKSGTLYEKAKSYMGAKPLDFGFKVWDLWYRNLKQFAQLWNLTESRVRRLKREGVPFEDIPLWADKTNPGRYSREFFKRHPEYANRLGRLYLVSFILNGQPMIKVGITSVSVEERVALLQGRRKRILSEYEGQLEDCYNAEQYTLECLKVGLGLKNAEGLVLDGKTETFVDPYPGRAKTYLAAIKLSGQRYDLSPKRLMWHSYEAISFNRR